MTETELGELKRTFLQLADASLNSAWDHDFVDDMMTRLDAEGTNLRITGKQWEQIQRMKEQYL